MAERFSPVLTLHIHDRGGNSIAEPGDHGVLNVAGMDASLPRVVAGFIRY